MFCTECAESIPKQDQRFCGNCGTRLSPLEDVKFGEVELRSLSTVREVVIHFARLMQAGKITVEEVKEEVSGFSAPLITVGHVAYFQIAREIFELPEKIGVLQAWPPDVLTMASRLQYVYGRDGAHRRILELEHAKVKVYKKDNYGQETNQVEMIRDEKGNLVPMLAQATFDTWGKHERYGEAVKIPTVAEHKKSKFGRHQ